MGNLLYAMICTRLDMSPGKNYLEVVKWVLRCLKCTSIIYLYFDTSKSILEDFTNAGYVDDLKERNDYF